MMQDAAVEILRRLVEALVAALNERDDVPERLSVCFTYRETSVRLAVRFEKAAPDVDTLHLLALPHHAPLMVFSEQ